jgi:hypothetical protein
VLACLVSAVTLTMGPLVSVQAPLRAAAVATAPVNGLATTWRISLLKVRTMNRVPNTDFANSWVFYKSTFFHFFVMTIQLANTGQRSANPYTDLNIVIWPRRGGGSAYTELARDRPPQGRIMQVAAREYGGAAPWTATAPGRTTTYIFVYAATRGQTNFAMLNFDSTKGYTYLFDTGV